MPITARWLTAVVLAGLLVGCGGSDSSDPAASIVPAQPGSADIGPAGGSVSAIFEGGATVTLAVPAGALAAATTIRIDPAAAPGDALTAVSMSPAGLQFKVPATLKVTMPATADARGLVVAFDVAGTRVPIGAVDPVSRTMSVALPTLGIGAAEPATARIQEHAGTMSARAQGLIPRSTLIQLAIQRGDLNGMLVLWHLLVDTLSHDGSRDNAILVQEGFGGVLMMNINTAGPVTKNQVVADAVTWGNVVCGQLTFAVSTINHLGSSTSPPAFAQAVKDVIAWGQLMSDFNSLTAQLSFPVAVPCPALQPDIADPVRAAFPAFLNSVQAGLALLSPMTDFNQLLTARVPELLGLDAVLRLVGTVDDLAGQVAALAVNEVVALRQGAYDDCRFNQKQTSQRDLLERLASDPSFDAISPYRETDLFSDIEYCGMAIAWELTDAQGKVMRSGTAGGGTTAGVITPKVTLSAAGAFSLKIKGPLSALMCPGSPQTATTVVPPHSNNEQLTFNAGPLGSAASALSSMVVLTPASDSHYLFILNQDLLVSRLMTIAQPTGSGDGELDIGRQGDLCSGEFPNLSQHRTLVKFELSFGAVAPLVIATPALPAAVVGQAYAGTVAATGGTPPYLWSASGLPAGLAIDALSGAISGTPTGNGTFTATIAVASADGQTQAASTAISSVLAVAGTYSGDVQRFLDGSGSTHHETVTMVVRQNGDVIDADLTSVLTNAGITAGPKAIPNESAHGPLHLNARLLPNSRLTAVLITNSSITCAGGFGLNAAIPLEFGGANPTFFRLNLLEADCHAVAGVFEMLDGTLRHN